jgi:hypothetical protein
MKRRAVLTLGLISILLGGSLSSVTAQDATPGAVDDHIDLAAMALDSGEMPADFRLAAENYVSGQAYAESVSANAQAANRLLDTGLIVYYESRYENAAGDQVIRSYIEQYDSPDGATAGFKILEDESSFESNSATFADEPLEGIGEAPGEITTYNVKAQNGNAATDGVDVTFREGNFIVGVSIDSMNGSAPADSDAITLARALQDRVQNVLAGKEIQGIDSDLPGRMVQFDYPPLLEGYVTAADVVGPLATDEVFKNFKSGYSRTTAFGASAQQPFPVAAVSILEFSTEDGPLAVLSAGTKYQTPYQKLAEVELDPIEGADAVAGFHFSSPAGDGKSVDSFRLLSVVGDDLVSIEVQAAASEEVAKRLAIEFTKAQLACLSAGNCQPIDNVETGS